MVPMGFLSQFGSAVWLAIAYIYIMYILGKSFIIIM